VRLSWTEDEAEDPAGGGGGRKGKEKGATTQQRKPPAPQDDGDSELDFGDADEEDLDIAQLTFQFDKELKERLHHHQHFRP
jgi:hypothetical protein